jgi:two-component system, NarL family, response regulator
MSKIHILLVEDNELFRLGLSTRLAREPDLTILAEAEDGETAIQIVNSNPAVDLVIIDTSLPGISGLETCRHVKAHRPHLPILVLTSNSESQLINDLIVAKVQGYCLKGVYSDAIVLAIRSLMMGSSWWDSIATQEIFNVFKNTNNAKPKSLFPLIELPLLTRREQEILVLVSTGKSNQEIATILYIAPGTVRVHIHTILSKLGVRDRTQAAIFAIEQGIVDRQLFESSGDRD